MTEPDPETFREAARKWLADRLPPRPDALAWGQGSDGVPVFHSLDHQGEAQLVAELQAWQQQKFDAGYGAITWPGDLGGMSLPPEYEQIFRAEEQALDAPGGHELMSVTVMLVAPTVQRFGTAAQRERFVRPFLRADELCCQLFSEPTAGSDLAGLGTRAVRDGDQWVINGQKVWSSGAAFAGWGELIARTDPDVPKHAGMTAFLLPLDAPGVAVRPIRQMSGGASFCEVFFDDVRIPDGLRLGEVGEGWQVALTTLGFERGGSASARKIGGGFEQVLALARHLGMTADPVVRQRLADLYVQHRLTALTRERAAGAAAEGRPPGPEGSIGKLRWATDLARTSDVVSGMLGARLVADTGEWGTYAWTAHVLGAPGYRIAGGSDEVQRNILAERVLRLPAEPRVDRDVPWRDVPR